MPELYVSTVGSTAIRWVLLILAVGGGGAVAPTRSAGDEPARPDAKSAKLGELLKERVATTRAMAAEVKTRFKNREGTVEQLLEATRIHYNAELDSCDTDKERVSVLEKLVTEATDIERIATQYARAGQGMNSSALMAKAARLTAEIALERTKAKAPARSK